VGVEPIVSDWNVVGVPASPLALFVAGYQDDCLSLRVVGQTTRMPSSHRPLSPVDVRGHGDAERGRGTGRARGELRRFRCPLSAWDAEAVIGGSVPTTVPAVPAGGGSPNRHPTGHLGHRSSE
jgi:hypothetical protein